MVADLRERKKTAVKHAKLSPFLALVALVMVLALAPSAIAQNSSATTYGGEGGDVVAGSTGDPADPSGTASGSSSGSLPFTGLDLSLLVGGGLVLIGIGVGMARIVPRHRDAA